MARKQDKMPARNKKNFRPTKAGAGMTRAGVAAYRRANPGSKLKTAVTGKVTGRALSKLFNHNEGTDAPKGPESYEAQYKRRLVKTTDPEHKAKGYKYRIKGKKDSSLTKKLYKSKPNQAEFNRQMRRIAGHEFG